MSNEEWDEVKEGKGSLLRELSADRLTEGVGTRLLPPSFRLRRKSTSLGEGG